MRSDAPEVGFWNRLATAVPQAVKIAGVRDTAAIIAEIAAELACAAASGPRTRRRRSICSSTTWAASANCGRRTISASPPATTASRPTPPSSSPRSCAKARRWASTRLIWCDTYSNVARMLDRQNMQDFEMRVLFQMNANDSSSLMDSPEASRLGVHRAILYDEGQGLAEKFRPYGLPSNDYSGLGEEAAVRARRR